jgi:hypothetical protein
MGRRVKGESVVKKHHTSDRVLLNFALSLRKKATERDCINPHALLNAAVRIEQVVEGDLP